MDSSIFETVRNIICDIADIPPQDITLQSVMMDDLSLSSMELMTVVNQAERAFALTIPEKDLRRFITVGDLVSYLESHTK